MPEESRGAQETGGGGGALPPSPLVHRPDLWVTAILLAFCGMAWYATTLFEEVSALFADRIGPEWFPRLMIWSIVVLTLALPFEHLFVQGGRSRLDEERTARVDPMIPTTSGLLLAAVLSVGILGMVLSTMAVCALLPILWGERRAKVLVPFAILFPAAIALLFSQILGVYFEPGLIGFSLG